MKTMLSLAAIPLHQAKPYVKNFKRDGIAAKTIKKFAPKGTKGYRVYIPIDTSHLVDKTVTAPEAIIEAVAQAGYVIEDYITGIAASPDGKKRIRIGKLIKTNPELADIFKKDPARNVFKSDAVCVISCHPYDIAGMSTGRHWTSCMNLNDGVYSEHVIQDVVGSTLIAYAIAPNDTNIQNPKARFLIKLASDPKDPSKTIYVLEASHYGASVPGFEVTLKKWLKKVNTGMPHGFYKFDEDLYDDGIGSRALHMPAVSEIPEDKRVEALKAIPGIEHHAETVLRQDVEWFPYLFRILVEMESSGSRYRQIFNTALRGGYPLKQLGEQIDNTWVVDPETLSKIFDAYTNSHLTTHNGLTAKEILSCSKRLRELCDKTFNYDAQPERLIGYGDLLVYCQFDIRWMQKIRFSQLSYRERGHVIARVLEQDLPLPIPYEPVQAEGREVVRCLEFLVSFFKGWHLPLPPRFEGCVNKLDALGFGRSILRKDNNYTELEDNGALKVLEIATVVKTSLSVYAALIDADVEWTRDLCTFLPNMEPKVVYQNGDRMLELQAGYKKLPDDQDPIAYSMVRAVANWTRIQKRTHKDLVEKIFAQAEKFASKSQSTYLKSQRGFFAEALPKDRVDD